MIASEQRRALRRQMRAGRAAVSHAERTRCSERLVQLVSGARILKPGQQVAMFASMPDEPDTAPLLRLAAMRGAHVYLPRIDSARTGRMSFAPLGNRWRKNYYGIAEPDNRARMPAVFLHVIFMPLLAFDSAGMRLGMGGGFYDRALAFRRRCNAWTGPKLIGIAYDFQEAPHVPALAHDIGLDAVVTPRGLHWFSHTRGP